jgi:signal transduction histidine kinase
VKRKLTIRTKLAATLAVPLAALASFAALQVRDSYNRADQVKLQAGLATSATGPAGALTALENERDYEALRAIGEQNLVAPKNAKFSAQVTAGTDIALGNFRQLLGSVGGAAAGNYRSTLTQVSTGLSPLRQLAEDDAAKSSTPANAENAGRIFDRYTSLIGQLLDADQRSGATIDDSELRSGAELLNALARQSDTESGVGIKVGLAAITHDSTAILDAQQLADRQAQGDADLRVRADGPFERAIVGALDAPARKAAVADLQTAARNPLGANLVSLLKIRPDSINLLRVAQTNTAAIVTAQAGSLTSNSQDEERNWMAITIGSVLLAIGLLWLTNRWITRPLRALADQAADMAGKGLPAAVQEILETPVNETVVQPRLTPVSVRAGGEVHDVEVALNRVQDSAVSLAVEQATLRRSIADAYVNLGRRNQNLLSRQLEFITQLENDESDPETLEHLFRLDHLATRMRRNAESLLVLAGLAPPRTWSAPVAMGDVVRGALGEVEGYRRVRLRHVDDARVDGTAAADVSHVIAELVENALSFSPPDADVEVYGRRDEHGYVITVVDSGIGMHDEELDRANTLISASSALTLAPSRFLGHYVVAQLAARHGLAVQLVASPAGGLTAMIALPGVLLGLKNEPMPAAPDDAAALFDSPLRDAERPPLGLPRREPVAEAAPISFRDASSSPSPAPEVAAGPPDLFLVGSVDEEAAHADAPATTEFQGVDWQCEFDAVDAEVASDTVATDSGEPVSAVDAPVSWHRPDPAPEPAPEVHVAPETQPVGVAEPSPVAEIVPSEIVPSEIAASEIAASEIAASEIAASEIAASEIVTPEPAPPAPAARPRLGLGSFADLRGVTQPVPTPDVPAPVEPETPAVSPAAAVTPASVPVPGVDPDRPSMLAPDRRASFAEVAQAVDVAAGRPVTEPASPFSEDLIPQRLPKRGRRASRLETPWVRERPTASLPEMAVHPAGSGSAPASVSASVPATAGASPGPLPSRAAAESRGASAPAPSPEANGASVPEPDSASASADGGERFAFFAAFRAAAEQAREEAGIDDRRGH